MNGKCMAGEIMKTLLEIITLAFILLLSHGLLYKVFESNFWCTKKFRQIDGKLRALTFFPREFWGALKMHTFFPRDCTPKNHQFHEIFCVFAIFALHFTWFHRKFRFSCKFYCKIAYFKDISYVCIVNHETIFLLHEPLGCIKIASLGFICIVLNPSGFWVQCISPAGCTFNAPLGLM